MVRLHDNSSAVLRFALSLTILIGCLCAPAAAGNAKAVPPDHAEKAKQGLALFKSHVRPLLVKHCLDCHGGKSVKADFDLSTRKLLMDSGYVDKTAEDSYLVELIEHRAEPHMPFKEPRLSDEAIGHIRKWIELGAPYDKPLVDSSAAATELAVTDDDRNFWSFRPLRGITPPAVENEDWCRTPIDRFILGRQEEQGLVPNESASRRKLIRRAYFDLIGLPPTPEEVEQFVSDTDPHAWSKLIDRLLDSEHYGERWARHWMDVARFAESHGYEQDYDRPHAYHYRDFLIKALNADMPFDQFVRWQLAGDELAPDEPLAMMATGFLGAGAFPTQLTEAEFESARYDELDDMVATTGVAFLGLSIGCARCHDHKFDPIPAADYYRMAANFTTTIRSEIDLQLDADEYRRAKQKFDGEHAALEAKLQEYESGPLQSSFQKWLTDAAETPVQSPLWRIVEPVLMKSTGGATLELQPDGSILASGKKPNQDQYVFTIRTEANGLAAVRIEALTHESLTKHGPGRAGNGNFALTDLRITARPVDQPEAAPQPVNLASAAATHEQNDGVLSVRGSIDDNPQSGWAVDFGGIGKDQAAVFTLAEPLQQDGQVELTFTMKFDNNVAHSLGRLRLSVTTETAPVPSVDDGMKATLAEAFSRLKKGSPDQLNDAQRTALFEWFASRDEKWKELNQAVAEHVKQAPQPKTIKVQVTSEGFQHMKHHADGRGFPHFYPETYHLERGDVQQKKEVARAGYLQVLMRDDADNADWSVSPPDDWDRTSFRRAALADWMTDVEQGAGHLVARVIVNRLWQHHFGKGIVTTPNDFGISGERPTHPELLDWLARDLVENGWRLKRLHKLMMTSSVYMQTADYDEQRAAIDRDNRLYWRRPPRRLEAEAIRDAMLTVSNQLDPQMYGPGTLDQNMRRRSIYFFIKRSQLIPMMMLFDWPEHLVSIGQRARTTIAPQALMFMNSPQGRFYADEFAKRLHGLEDSAAIVRAYEIAFGRAPSQQELQLLGEFLKEQAQRHAQTGVDDAAHRARTDMCQALLGMNEFIYVE
ncbi:DUF1549 domain-containing protein [Maioricimonas rarisocia]|nr:DUF1549 domain-containing protein [Maioricimonas rarisocia]